MMFKKNSQGSGKGRKGKRTEGEGRGWEGREKPERSGAGKWPNECDKPSGWEEAAKLKWDQVATPVSCPASHRPREDSLLWAREAPVSELTRDSVACWSGRALFCSKISG